MGWWGRTSPLAVRDGLLTIRSVVGLTPAEHPQVPVRPRLCQRRLANVRAGCGVAVPQQAGQAPDGVCVELDFHSERQQSRIAAHMVGQLGQDLSRCDALDESVEHLAFVAPEDVREHSPEAQAYAVDGLVDALP